MLKKIMLIFAVPIIGIASISLVVSTPVKGQVVSLLVPDGGNSTYFLAFITVRIPSDDGYGFYADTSYFTAITPHWSSPKGCSDDYTRVQPTDITDFPLPRLPNVVPLIDSPAGSGRKCLYNVQFPKKYNLRLSAEKTVSRISSDNDHAIAYYDVDMIPIVLTTTYPEDFKPSVEPTMIYGFYLGYPCDHIFSRSSRVRLHLSAREYALPGYTEIFTADTNIAGSKQRTYAVPAYADAEETIPCTVQAIQFSTTIRYRYSGTGYPSHCPPVDGSVQTVEYEPGMESWNFNFQHNCLGEKTEADNLHTSMGYYVLDHFPKQKPSTSNSDLLPPFRPDGSIDNKHTDPVYMTDKKLSEMKTGYRPKPKIEMIGLDGEIITPEQNYMSIVDSLRQYRTVQSKIVDKPEVRIAPIEGVDVDAEAEPGNI